MRGLLQEVDLKAVYNMLHGLTLQCGAAELKESAERQRESNSFGN